jgi:alpha-N-arabinofuranosidase
MLSADSNLILAAAATPNRNWTLPLLHSAGEHLHFVAVHSYWLPYWQENQMPDYLSCIMHAEGPEEIINKIINIIDEAGFRGKIKIAYDEWNLRGWHHPGFPRKEAINPEDYHAVELINKREINKIAKQYTMADALFSASFLNACLRHCEDVGMANIAPIVNTRGPLYVHSTGVVKRTTFHTLAMYANLLENHVGSLHIVSDSISHEEKSIPIVDAVATTNESGKDWSIAVVNRHPDHWTSCTIKLGDWFPEGEFNATILTGDSPNAYNDLENPDRVIPGNSVLTFHKGVVNLPPHSLIILEMTMEF